MEFVYCSDRVRQPIRLLPPCCLSVSVDSLGDCLHGMTDPSMGDMIRSDSPSPPVGSEIFSLLSLAVISLGVLLLLRYYLPLRTTPAYLLVPIFFALSLPASIILLVPIDLASSARDEHVESRGIWLPNGVLLVAWRICYWLTFVLSW